MNHITQGIIQAKQVLTQPYLNKTLIIQMPLVQPKTANATLIKLLQGNGYRGIYITLDKTYTSISDELTKQGIELAKLSFIDGISRLYGSADSKSDNVCYIRGPLALKELSNQIKINLDLAEAEQKFIFLDSLTSLMLYHPTEELINFLHDLNEITANKKVLVFASLLSNQASQDNSEFSFKNEAIGLNLKDLS